ncbi:carboxymuconolactone decarboxylase [Marinilongibacter aquaticus]|uniref:carboxymuconolactone decarboxylase family protein n=1 Tax=Marinilongibacter aquaticus TaxID=2975157 RepID=UPI0021BDDE20|nr:carboxymuconolactone decarboxylase family protein [Marinilongibacter aquaticus]UBM58186.1 carboxymuconolactone decarboxylase [Marinilongibacter aquaticus]
MTPYIDLPENLFGITSLLEYRLDTAEPIRVLTQSLLRGPSSLSEGERELIAAIVSTKNCTAFCTAAHTTVADHLLHGPQSAAEIVANVEEAKISEKMKALLQIAASVQENGKQVSKGQIDRAKKAEASDREIHDTVLIAALFCLYNRYVDGLNTRLPEDTDYYQTLAARISKSYMRQPQ